MTTSQDIVDAIFSDAPNATIVDQIMDALNTKVYDSIESKKTEVFAKEMNSIPSTEEEEEE